MHACGQLVQDAGLLISEDLKGCYANCHNRCLQVCNAYHGATPAEHYKFIQAASFTKWSPECQMAYVSRTPKTTCPQLYATDDVIQPIMTAVHHRYIYEK
jgi:hypothetical protein